MTDYFTVSADDKRYEKQSFKTKDEALTEARNQSLRPNYKNIAFVIRLMSSGDPIIIGIYENGLFSEGIEI